MLLRAAELRPHQQAEGSWRGCKARGSCAQQRGERRERDLTPRRSCEPSEHRQSWVEKPWGQQLDTKLRELAEHKTEQTVPWPTLDEWPWEQTTEYFLFSEMCLILIRYVSDKH